MYEWCGSAAGEDNSLPTLFNPSVSVLTHHQLTEDLSGHFFTWRVRGLFFTDEAQIHFFCGVFVLSHLLL